MKQFILFTSILLSSICYAKTPLNDTPIVIDADQFEYIGNETDGSIIARGNVIAKQDNQTVDANFIKYDFKKEILIAEDQVKIIDKDGYIIDADKVILSDRLTLGSIYGFTVLMPDKSTLKGTYAKKNNEFISNIEKGSYTSCRICPGKSPIWEMTARSTEIDKKENKISYKHAFFKFYGVPSFYTPYFSHYTTKSKRRSGFLRPKYVSSSYLGATVKTPYYLNLAPHYDATITPIITKKRGNALAGEARYLTPQGQIDSAGSITSAKYYDPPSGQAKPKHDIRYHFLSNTNLDIGNDRNIGWNINTTSDQTYHRNYNYGQDNFLTSRFYKNSYQEKGFYEVQALSFQNLRPNNPDDPNAHPMTQTPIVMPLFDSKHQIFRFDNDSTLNFESNLLKIHRYNGVDSNRFSIKNSWNKSLLLDSGHDFNLFTSLRNDIYYYKNASPNNLAQPNTGSVTRTIPEAGAAWSYPLTNKIGSHNVMIAPLASATITPYSNYNKDIYSEDASTGELTDGNLFAPSQYNGIDLIESTPRVGYGLKGSTYYKSSKHYFNSNALFGQMYRQKPRNYISGSSEQKFSDYIGRLKFDFNDRVILSYQYKLDRETYVNKTNELSTLLKYKKAYILTDLLYYRDNQIVDNVKNRREIYVETGINNYKGIIFSVYGRKSLSSRKDNPTLYVDPSGFIKVGTKLRYLNDCIEYSTGVNKDFTNRIGAKPNTTWWFNISLKNIT